MATEPVRDPKHVAVYNSVAGGLRRAGVAADEVYGLILVCENFLLGCAFDLTAPETVAPSAVDAASYPELRDALDSAPPGVERAEQSVEMGLTMLIAGIRARIEANS